MELMLKDINVCEYNKILSVPYSAEADIIVPDTKPDIHKILCVNAVADLSEHYIRKGKVVFSGDIKFNIMYVGDIDKKSIYTIDYSLPFNHQAELDGADDDFSCIAICSVSSTEFKIKNSRKLLARGNLNLNAQISVCSSKKALEDICGDDSIPYLKKSIVSEAMVNSKNFSFSVSDTIMLPEEYEETTILDMSAYINAEEIKTVNNKAIIKGTVPIRIFYMSDTSPKVYETECAFTEIADMDMAGPDSIVASHFAVSDISYEINDDENRLSIDVDVKISSVLKAYETTEYPLISDIYSPDFSYSINKINSSFERYTKLSPCQITVKDIIGSKNNTDDISQIYYMNVYPAYRRTTYDGSSIIVYADLHAVVIYSNSEGEMCSVQKNIPCEADIGSVNGLENSLFDVSLSVVNYGYVLSSESDVQIRVVLNFSVGAYTRCDVGIITDFAIDKSSPIDKSSQSGIVVCYPDGNMTLWDYAVKYNTTCKEIACVNNLDEEKELPKGFALIIPKRQI